MSTLSPPWSRDQVRWCGEGFFILRLALDDNETSRWLLGAAFKGSCIFPHEKNYRRPAIDKSQVILKLKMNPWPIHLAGKQDAKEWCRVLSKTVEQIAPVVDTGHLTLWRVEQFALDLAFLEPFVVLDGHHSRKAQRYLGLDRIFGWVEPLGAPQLQVRAIHRAGWLARWIEALLAAGELRILPSAPSVAHWFADRSMSFEVVQADRRSWCEVVNPFPGESVGDALARLAKGSLFLRTTADFDETLSWLKGLEVDACLRLPQPSKTYVWDRAMRRELFPQKSTYFHPKIPFGVLVEDLASSDRPLLKLEPQLLDLP